MRDAPVSIHLLHVDDDPALAELAAEFLNRIDDEMSVDAATSAGEGLDLLAENEYDCVVSDYDMPGKNGIEFLETVREENPDLPFILYTGKGSEEIASDAISAGVTDYLRKGSGTSHYTVLANRIRNAVDQYRTKTALAEGEKRLNLFFEQSPLGIIEWDDSYELRRMNDAAEEILGYEQQTLAGESWEVTVPESDTEAVRDVVTNLLENTGGYHSINENVREDGERIVCEWHNRVITDDDGEVVAVLSHFQDITDKQRLKEERQEIIERVTDAIVEVDAEWRFTLLNEQAEDLYDMPEEDLLGRDFWAVFEEAKDTRFEEEYRGVMETREPASFVEYFSQLDGWFDIEAYPKDDGGIAFYFVEVTEQRQREQELEQTNALLSTLFDTLPVGVLAEDASRNVLEVNERLFELFEFSGAPEEVIGTDCERLSEQISDMFVDSDEFVQRINNVVVNREPTDNEELSLTDGRTFERSYRPCQLPDGDGHLWMYRDITDRKERERRYDAIFNNTFQFTGLLEPDGTLIEANETALEFGGLDREDVIGKKMWEAYWFQHSEETRTRAREAVNRAASGEFIRQELPVQGANDEVTIDFSVRPLTDELGNVTLLIPEGRDITELKEQERDLHETKRRLDLVLAGTDTGIWEWEIGTDEVEWNETLERAIGLESGSFKGNYQAFADRVHPDDLPQVEAAIERAIDTDDSYQAEFRMINDKGGTVWAEAQGLVIEEHDAPDRMVGLFRDVTERKERESRLSGLNQTMHQLIAADTREQIGEIGVEAARDVLGLEANAIHLYDDGQAALVPVAETDTLTDLIGQPPTFTGGESIAWRAYEQGESVIVDDVHEDPDAYNPETPIQSELHLPLGEYGILIAGSDTPEAFDQQNLVFGEILAGGITAALEQVERTEQLRVREQELTRQNERLEEFTSIVSHDLRNPLSVAEGRLELAREECDNDHLDDVDRALTRMNVLIDDLLALAREGEQVGEPEMVDLATLTENCWRNVATAEATLTTDVELILRADASRLQQLLENLLGNAVDQAGEDVTITIGELADGFYVEDDGPGIPEGARDDVFEAGYSTSDEGAGFGLSIVKQVAQAHGWTVRVTEESAGGARFEITGVEFAAE